MTTTHMPAGEVENVVGRQAAEWFVANRDGPLSPSNRAAFTAWLRTSPIHVREYLAVSSLARGFHSLPDAGTVNLGALVERARQEGDAVVSIAGRGPARAADNKLTRGARVTRWAAAAGVAAILSGVALLIQRQDGLPQPALSDGNDVLVTAHGEQRIWRLPDGSVVHLNSGSGLKAHFSDTRRVVEITGGQALFDVVPDARRPFRVVAGNTEVVALGTSFDVYCKEDMTVVTVVTGKVAVYKKPSESSNVIPDGITTDALARQIEATPVNYSAPSFPLPVKAGEQVQLPTAGKDFSYGDVDVVKAVAWTQQQIMFDRERLGDVVNEFNRYGRTPLEIEGEALNSLRITGIFNAYDTESFIGFLSRLQDVRVRTLEGKITVSKNSGT